MNALKVLAALLCLGVFAIGANAAPARRHTKPHAKPAAADSALAAEAKIDMKTARATAVAKVPGGAVQSEELEREHGKLIYSFDLKVKGKPGIDEVNVDAISGAIVAVSHEGPKTERKEAAAEKKAASTGARH
jgi:hypothetical protein